jgi:hypothetical protein
VAADVVAGGADPQVPGAGVAGAVLVGQSRGDGEGGPELVAVLAGGDRAGPGAGDPAGAAEQDVHPPRPVVGAIVRGPGDQVGVAVDVAVEVERG